MQNRLALYGLGLCSSREKLKILNVHDVATNTSSYINQILVDDAKTLYIMINY